VKHDLEDCASKFSCSNTPVFRGELHSILLLPWLFGTMVPLTSLVRIVDRLLVLLFG
jgi:hypothetical protein